MVTNVLPPPAISQVLSALPIAIVEYPQKALFLKLIVVVADSSPLLSSAVVVNVCFFEPELQLSELSGDNKFINQIMKDEGKPFLEATKVFKDEKNFSIGYGRNNANVKKGDKITLEKAQENLAEDVKIRLEEIQDLIPNFSNLSDQLQLALFSEYYRGSVRQSPKTVKLINEGKFSEAAAEFLDNDEYRNAVDRGRRGIRKRMKKVFNLLRREGTEDSPAV